MYKKIKVYICSYCGEIERPEPRAVGMHGYTDLPCDWERLGTQDHLCGRCAAAYKKLRKEERPKP